MSMSQDPLDLPKQSYKELTVQGKRKRGRRRKRWEDITEWTGEVLSDYLRAEDRQM